MQQTYVGMPQGPPYWSALGHRLSQMCGNSAFVYVNGSGYTIEQVIDGSLDEQWLYLLDQLPANAIFAPLAEMNGGWVDYHGTIEQAAAAYAHLSELDAGRHTVCGSFTVMANSDAYLQAVAPYVDLACPSVYDNDGTHSPASVAAVARAHAASAGLPLILAQTGTVRENKPEWTLELTAELGNTVAIYFDNGRYAFENGWPW